MLNKTHLIHEQNEELKAFRDLQQEIIEKQDTDLRTAVEQLNLRNSQIIEYSKINSHNVRGPLASILGMINLLASGYVKPNEAADVFHQLKASGEQLDSIVKQINHVLNLSVSPEYTDINLLEVLSSVEEDVKRSYPGINWTYVQEHIDTNAIHFEGNITSVHNILTLLVDNAVKFRGSEMLVITYAIKKVETLVHLRIQDNGLGFDSRQFEEKIFGLHNRFNPQITGSGMGLYLAKLQMDILRGKISLYSEPGKGCTIDLFFPTAVSASVKA